MRAFVRSGILGFVTNESLRKHLPRIVVIDQERKLEREPEKRPPRHREAAGAQSEMCQDEPCNPP